LNHCVRIGRRWPGPEKPFVRIKAAGTQVINLLFQGTTYCAQQQLGQLRKAAVGDGFSQLIGQSGIAGRQ
jgi:hypothetical protein